MAGALLAFATVIRQAASQWMREDCNCARLTSMRRARVIAVLFAGLILPSTLHSQMRSAGRPAGGRFSGFRASGPGPSGGFRSFGPSRPTPGPAGRGAFRPGATRSGPSSIWAGRPGPGALGFRGHRGGPFSPWHHFNYFQPWFQPSLWSYWGGYPGYYSGPGYPLSSLSYPGFPEDYQAGPGYDSGEQAQAAPDYGSGAPYDDTLANQVQRLTDEVEALRQQAQPPASAGTRPAERQQPTPTVFAYRDGHKLEAQNYAIQGQTLWVFGDQITRKISLADLDLGTTKQLNDERGVEFAVPQSR